MKLTIAQVSAFVAEWRKLRLTDEDLAVPEKMIMDNPDAGAVMAGTGGIRKLRFAPPSWDTGKRGATRVCYVVFAAIEAAYLLTVVCQEREIESLR